MQETIKIDVNVADNGTTDKANKNAQELKNTLKGAAAAAESIRIPIATAAARQGVAASQPKSAAYMAAAGPSGTASDTNLSRGISGNTGASGRDFAAQAQGLGGLVHVYATFAANLYAVSAAYTALSKAADTSNLIKGLDQLGAASGRTYSTLAKQLVSVADGALSMQQAMSSTAMGTAAGMSNANMVRMTEIAKKASQALGRDMADSMDRLTKGIIKTQPELLDELGIMTRVIPAQQAYAREIGKTTDQLNSYEKQQAFANAVLAEGELKFSNIKLDANPYSKLSASMMNIAQSGLELVNVVLTPIAKLLAESPMGLATVMAGIAGVLIKQAIPALGQFRKGLEAANQLKLEKITDFHTATAQGESGTYDAKRIERSAETFKKEQGYAEASAAKKIYLDEQIAKLEEQISRDSEARSKRLFSHERNIQTQKDSMYKDAAITQSKVMVSQVASTYGTSAAFSELNHQISQLKAGTAKIDVGDKIGQAVPKINALRGAFMYATGAVTIFGTALGTVMAVLAPYIEIIGLIIVGLTYLDGRMSKATKEQESFTATLENSTAAIKTANDAIDNIYSKKTGIVSVESTNAASNALTGINEALKDQLTAYDKLGVKQNSYDKKWDSFWSMMGKGNLDKLVKSTSEEVPAALDVMALKGTKASEELTDALSKIIPKNINLKDSKAINDYLDTLSKPEREKAIRNISKAITSIEESTRKTTTALNDFVASLQKTQDLSDELTNKLKLTGEGAIGEGLIKSGELLGEALKSPVEGLNAIIKLGNDMKTISLLPPNLAQEIMSAKTEAEGLARSLETAMKARKEETTKREDLVNKGDYMKADSTAAQVIDVIGSSIGGVAVGLAGTFVGAIGGPLGIAAMGSLGTYAGIEMGSSFTQWIMSKFGINTGKTEKGQQVDTAIAEADKRIIAQMKQIETFVKSLEPYALRVQEAGLQRFSSSLSAFAVEAAAIIGRANISTKQKAGLDTSAEELQLKIQEIDQNKKTLEAAYEQQKAINDNTDALNKATAAQAVTNSLELKRAALIKGDPVEIAKADQSLKNAQKSQVGSQVLESKLSKGKVPMPAGADQIQIQAADNTVRGRNLEYLAFKAKISVENAKAFAATSDAANQRIEEDFKKRGRLVEQDKLTNTNISERIGLYQKMSQGYSEILEKAKLDADITNENIKYTQSILDIDKQIAFINRTNKNTAEAKLLVEQLNYKKASLSATRDTAIELLKFNSSQTTFLEGQKKITEQYNHQKALQEQLNNMENARGSVLKQELSQGHELGIISDEAYTNRKAQLDLQEESRKQSVIELDNAKAVRDALAQQEKIAKDILENDKKYGTADSKNKPDLSKAKQDADYAVQKADAIQRAAIYQGKVNIELINSAKTYGLIRDAAKAVETENARILSNLESSNKVLYSKLDLEKQRLENGKALNKVSEDLYINQSEQQALDRLEAQYNEDKLKATNEITKALKLQSDVKEAIRQADRLDARGNSEGAAAIRPDQTVIDTTNKGAGDAQQKLADINTIYANNKLITAEGAEQSRNLKIQNDLLKQQEALGASLVTLFGDMGTALMEGVKALTAAAKAQKDLDDQKQKDMDALAAKYKDTPERDMAGQRAYLKEKSALEQKYIKKSTEENLAGLAATAKANKKMFDEKSAGYKILNGIERASSIMTMAMKAKELATSIANDGLLIASKIPAIFASFMASMGPFGIPAAAAAIAAFIGTATGGGGGEPEKPQTYDEFKTSKGNVTGVGGVAGDSSAINEGLKNTLDSILELASPQLQYTSLMSSYLRVIANNTGMMANSVEAAFASRDTGIAQGNVSLRNEQGRAPITAAVGIIGNAIASSVITGVGGLMAQGAGMLAGYLGPGSMLSKAVINTSYLFADMGSFVTGTFSSITGGLTSIISGIGSGISAAAGGLLELGSVGASVTSGLAGLGSVLPGIGTVVGALVGTLVTSIPAVQNFLFGENTLAQSISGFGAAINDQTLAVASSNIQMQRYDDVLTTITHNQGAFEQGWNWLTGGDTSDQVKTSTERVRSDLRTPEEKAFAKQIQGVYAGIKDTLTVASSVLDVDTGNLNSFRIQLQDIDLSSGTAEEKMKRLNGGIAKNADAFAKQLLPSIDEFTHTGDTAFQAFTKLASAQEQVGQITDALGIKSIKYSEIINKQGDYAAEMLRQSIVNSEGTSGIGKIINSLNASAADMATVFIRLKDVRASFVALGYSGELVNAQLLKGAGGIDSLSNALAKYEEKYLNAAERNKIATVKLADAWAPLTGQLAAAGYTVPKTKEGFKGLVNSLAAGGESSSELLGKVLLLSEGFDKVASSAEETLNKSLDQIQKMYELQGRGDMAKAIARAKELKALDETLRPMQEYLYALEDEVALKSKLQTAYDKLKTSLTGTINGLKNSIETLQKYKTSLQFGDKANLTPQEAYAAAKGELESVAATASQKLGTEATPEQIAARDKAAAALPQVMDQFLAQSKTSFASGEQYQADYSWVNSLLDTTSATLDTQKTDAEQQLKLATDSTNYLSSVADNTKTTADLLSEFFSTQSDYIDASKRTDAAKTAGVESTISNSISSLGAINTASVSSVADSRGFAIPGHAAGGIARGVSLVGEKGPELVDFQNPGRVYPSSQTNMLGDNTLLINELKALRDEVAKLRDEQKEQTGQIIVSNYDANKRNADVVASTTESVARMQEWKERSKVVIS